MKKLKGALGLGEFVLLIIAIIVTLIAVLVVLCKVWSFGIVCKGIGVEIKESYETFQEIPFKLDFAIYTFLKTKTCDGNGCISVEDCIKYIDCMNGCEKVPTCPEGYELCEENGNYFCRRYEIYKQCEKPQNPCSEGEEVYKEKKACTKSSCRKCSNERETYICKEDISQCGSCKEKYMWDYNSWIVWCQKKPEFVPKEEQVQTCKKTYGEQYDVEKCQVLIQKTLQNVWENKIKLTLTSGSSSMVFVANNDKYETIYPLQTSENKIFIPYPARAITLKFEVW